MNGPLTIADLQAQADAFRRRLAEEESRLNALTEGSTPFSRPPGIALRVRKMEEDVQGARQAYVNAERILNTARKVWGQDGP